MQQLHNLGIIQMSRHIVGFLLIVSALRPCPKIKPSNHIVVGIGAN